MEGTGGNAIEVWFVGACDAAEAVQVEVGISQFERIEGPLDEADISGESFFALEKLELSTDAAVAIVLMNAGVVGVDKDDAVAVTDDAERVAHEPRSVISAQDLAAGFRGDEEARDRLDFEVFLAPDLPLERNAGFKLGKSRALTYDDAVAHRCGATLRMPPRLETGPTAAACAAFSSLAEFQSDSFSGRGTSSNLRPREVARRSISWKRRTNLPLARLSAISGSICRNRARLTTAKSRSPSSSSASIAVPCSSVCCSSTVSSLILSKTPLAFSQSKPVRAAFFVSWRPSSVAGMDLGTPSRAETRFASPVAGATSLPAFSSALILAQLRRTSSESLARPSPKTCGWRRIILSWIDWTTSEMLKRLSSEAICE